MCFRPFNMPFIKQMTCKNQYKRINTITLFYMGARGGAVVEALCYKPEGRGIDSRWCHWIFSLT
jgi:hypothetical protein